MSSTPASNIPVSVNYTARDYYSLREEIIARIQDRIPEWTGQDPADFGVALAEAFAYLGDMLSYYIDRTANETLITTATQRKSILAIAQTYGYTPAGYRQAYTDLTFSNTSDVDISIPAGSIVSGDIVVGDTVRTVAFTTDSDSLVPAAVAGVPGTDTVGGSEGRSVATVSSAANSYGELIGMSDGSPALEYELGEYPVVDTSVVVYVQEGDQYTKWTRVQHLIDYGPSDLVYETYSDAGNFVFVKFGDGVSGKIPTAFSEVRALYMVGGGTQGNVAPNTITNIEYLPGLSEEQVSAVQAYILVTNSTQGVGGSDPETNDQIRVAAPKSLRALNRAVTLEDFESLAIGVTGVGKASASATVWTDVHLYIAPTRSALDTDPAPGYEADGVTPSVEYNDLHDAVVTAMENKLLIGTSLTVSPPTYVDAVLEIDYTALPQYTADEVELGIKNALFTAFGYVNESFKSTIYPQTIEFVLQQVAGVKYASVALLYRLGDVATRSTLVGAANEIFRFTPAHTTITPV
jgi:hypothetical protein